MPDIEAWMTPFVHTVRSSASLTEAHEMMRTHGFRHLPVLEAGRLVGLISERDLQLVAALSQGELSELTVEDAMTQDVLTVGPKTAAEEVAATMARRKAGSAVIVSGGKVRGIFTTVDALRALAGPRRRAVKAGRPVARAAKKTRAPAARS